MITNHFFKQDKDEKVLRTDNFYELLRFFEAKDEVNIVLAGYVSDVIEDLLLNEYKLVSDYLLSNLTIIENLIRHSYDYSVIKKILSPLVFQKSNGLSYSVIEDEENKDDRKLSKNLLVVASKLLNKLKEGDSEEACANILNMFIDVIDLDDDEKSRIEALEELLYSERTMGILFDFMANSSTSKSNLNLCLQALKKLILFYPKVRDNRSNKEKTDEDDKEKQEPKVNFCCLIQNFVDKIDFLNDTLKNQNSDSILDTRGDNKRLLSSTRIYVLKLLISVIELKNSIINVHLSLSGIFLTIQVSSKGSGCRVQPQ